MTTERNIWLNISKERIIELETIWEKDIPRMLHFITQLNLAGDSVLDVACGTGAYYPFLKSHYKNYTGLDTSEAMLAQARRKYPEGIFVQGDAKQLKYADKSFDLTFCMSLLIHMPLPFVSKVLSELWRLSKRRMVFNIQLTEGKTMDNFGQWGEWVSVVNRDEFDKLTSSYPAKKKRFVEYTFKDEIGNRFIKRFGTAYQCYLVLMER
jgi:ubiquinone/menaquinone biosynthesis C-methylase UbiE